MKNSLGIWGMLIAAFLLFNGIFNSITINGKSNYAEEFSPPTVQIILKENSTIYEGDAIECNITGNPTIKYWQINNQSKHNTFYYDAPLIFDPEPTPLNTDYVNLTVYAENDAGNASDTVQVIIKRIFFGDIHWHSTLGDGYKDIDDMYKNATSDKYLDFVASTEHAIPVPLRKILINFIKKINPWQIIKDKAIEYYDPGNFTTLLGFEWSASNVFPGGWKISPNGYDDVSHINFYYKDVYSDAPTFSPLRHLNYDDIFQAMSKEWEKGHLNICFPHHPLGKIYYFGTGFFGRNHPLYYNVNWSFLAKKIKNTNDRDKILRGVEVYSCWGTSIGQYSNITITWPYKEDYFDNKTDAWVENAMWEWSENALKGNKFVMEASSDSHSIDRPASALERPCTSGIIAAYTIHNTRNEIWDAMNNCDIYGSQLLKIRANVRFDGKMAYGQWINCSSPLKINITAQSTFPGFDNSGKNMCPHGYSSDELNYPIQDIWLIKKDTERGRPWCKIINHTSPNENTVAVSFEDSQVQPNDFYYVLIRQRGQEIQPQQNQYTVFIGPIFIDNVEQPK